MTTSNNQKQNHTDRRNQVRRSSDKSKVGFLKGVNRSIVVISVIAIFVIFASILYSTLMYSSRKIYKETFAHYQLLADRTTQEITTWFSTEAQIVVNQAATLSINQNFDVDYLKGYFKCIVDNYNDKGYIYDIYFVTTNNEMVSGIGYEPDGSFDFRQREYYIEAYRHPDELYYSAPYLDMYQNKYVVTISKAIFNEDNKLAGVLCLDIYVDTLFDIVNNADISEDSYIFLVDNNYAFATHPNDKFGYINDRPRNLNYVKNKGYKELHDILLAGKKSKYEFTDYDGVDRIFFTCPVEINNWSIVAAVSKKVIYNSVRELGLGIVLALIICLILGVFFALFMTNRSIKSIETAKNEADKANLAKSRFLANMSHEIRTPINAVLGMDEILIRDCKDDQLLEYAYNIRTSGENLLGIINDILDFNKVESGKLEIICDEYDTAQLVDECCNLVNLKAKEKGLEFNTSVRGNIPSKLYGDNNRIRQVIVNLLTNAVKYTKEGHVDFIISWIEDDNSKGFLKILVEDTGMGISKDKQDILFEPFSRLDQQKNRNIEGTGLGLAITKQLVEMMNGQIIVDSTIGKGSTFMVTIPQEIRDSKRMTLISVHNDNGKKKLDKITPFTAPLVNILVVDDVKMNLLVVKGLIKKTLISVDTAQSGIECINKVLEKKYDMVLIDDMMPNMSGVETYNKLQNEYGDKIKDIPFIMLTANALDGMEDYYKDKGFAGYLSKPVRFEDLVLCFEEFLPKEKMIFAENKE